MAKKVLACGRLSFLTGAFEIARAHGLVACEIAAIMACLELSI
jgi:hypothetical protein